MSAVRDTMRSIRDIPEEEFPSLEPLASQFTYLLRYVILAPSTFNTQPWKFRVSGEGIEIFGDYGRRLPIADPGNRELLISIGAAVMNLRVAAAHFHFACSVSYNYSGSSEDPLAFVRLIPAKHVDVATGRRASLFPSIVQRHTDREAFLGSRIPAAIVQRMQECSSDSDASVTVSIDGSRNEQIANLVARGDQLLLADPLYRRNLAEWMRARENQGSDGVPGESYGFDHRLTGLAQWVNRAVDAGKVRAARDHNLCLEAPGLIVVCSDETVPAWIAAGELLEDILLTLTREGVHHSYLNVPVHLPDLRMEVKGVLGVNTWPQLLLRIGYSLNPPLLTPRRSVENVLVPATAWATSAFTV